MTSDSTETVFEIRYRPNAKVLDHRGEWAEALAGHMYLPQWSIINNRFDVFAEDRTQHIFVSHRNAGMVCLDSPTSNFFGEKAQRFFRQLVKFRDFGDPLHVERIGVRHKLASPFDGTFDELVNRFHTRYVGLSSALIKAFEDANLVDIGAPLNFRDARGHFNTMAGPMLEAQFKGFFTKDEGLPEVGVFADVDYFVNPSTLLSSSDIVSTTTKLIAEAQRRAETIRGLILG